MRADLGELTSTNEVDVGSNDLKRDVENWIEGVLIEPDGGGEVWDEFWFDVLELRRM